MLHSLSELTIVLWIVAEVGSILFWITDHACKECKLLDLRKLAYIKLYQQECVVKLYRHANSVLEGGMWSVPCPTFAPGKET